MCTAIRLPDQTACYRLWQSVTWTNKWSAYVAIISLIRTRTEMCWMLCRGIFWPTPASRLHSETDGILVTHHCITIRCYRGIVVPWERCMVLRWLRPASDGLESLAQNFVKVSRYTQRLGLNSHVQTACPDSSTVNNTQRHIVLVIFVVHYRCYKISSLYNDAE